MAKHIGIVAVSAEGAALCYRTICAEGAALLGRHSHPEVTMHTYPLADYMRFVRAGDWDGLADLMLASADKLRRVGAELLICPDNTVHVAVDAVRNRCPIPWLDIADEVTKVAEARGFHRLLILGTRYLVEGPVYPTRCGARGIACLIPPSDDLEHMNTLIFEELAYGRFAESTREYFRGVIAEGREHGAEAAVLGCTEIPLVVDEMDSPLPTLDSTRILARAALRESTRSEE